MELFAKLFDSLLVFVYHCFDRIVIHGYLRGRLKSPVRYAVEMESRQPYDSDVTDAEWQYLELFVPAAKRAFEKPIHCEVRQ